MPAEIHIYFEGDRSLRPGFAVFFKELADRAAERRVRLRPISARSGEEARQDFKTALGDPDVWPVLLIDSEGQPPRSRDAHSGQTFWMVEMMEAWFHADKDALERFYGRDFKANALKANPNVEAIPKADLMAGLKAATRKCQKGPYHKTLHAPEILRTIDPTKVRDAAPNCDRLFQAILEHLN